MWLSGMSSRSVIDKQGSSLPTTSATFPQQAYNQHPHIADVISSDLLPSSFISISHVSVLKREGKEETEALKDGW